MTHWVRLGAVLALMSLAACVDPNIRGPQASVEQVSRAAYVHDGPPALTLYTMINNRTGSGAHSSLMINASQRVIFDPAGSVRLSAVPGRGDVLYGITPTVEDFYARAHARETYHVVIQRIEVSPQVAEQALQLAQARGRVPQAQCAASTAAILRQLPGFETIPSTWFPNRLMESFGELPGAQTTTLFEEDVDDKGVAIAEFERAMAGQ